MRWLIEFLHAVSRNSRCVLFLLFESQLTYSPCFIYITAESRYTSRRLPPSPTHHSPEFISLALPSIQPNPLFPICFSSHEPHSLPIAQKTRNQGESTSSLCHCKSNIRHWPPLLMLTTLSFFFFFFSFFSSMVAPASGSFDNKIGNSGFRCNPKSAFPLFSSNFN